MENPDHFTAFGEPFPFKCRGVSRVGNRVAGHVIYGFKTREDRDNHLKAEAQVMREGLVR